MMERVKRAHANNLKPAEVDSWVGLDPRSKKRKMRRATFVEPEDARFKLTVREHLTA